MAGLSRIPLMIIRRGHLMKFCTGWYRQTDGQQRYWDGQASAVPDLLAELRQPMVGSGILKIAPQERQPSNEEPNHRGDER